MRVVELDASDQSQAAQAIDGVVASWGRLNVLVNAAGILSAGRTTRGPVIGIAEGDWDRIMSVNVLGTVYCAQAAARHMIRQRSGRIVNIASSAGAIPRINAAAYRVSKAGVRMFTKDAHARLNSRRPPLRPELRVGSGEREDYQYNRIR